MSYNLSKDQIAWLKNTHGIDIKSIPTNKKLCWEKDRNLFIKTVLGLPDDFWELYLNKSNDDSSEYSCHLYSTLLENIEDTLFVNKITDRFKNKMKLAFRELKKSYDYEHDHNHNHLIEILKKFDVEGIDIIMDIYSVICERPWRRKHDGRSMNSSAVIDENKFTLENLEETIINKVFEELEGWFKKNSHPCVNHDMTNTFEEGLELPRPIPVSSSDEDEDTDEDE
jgi:hypothetical protein